LDTEINEMYPNNINILRLAAHGHKRWVIYAPYIPNPFRIKSSELLELTDSEIQNVLNVRTFSTQTFLNGKHEIVLKLWLFVLDFSTVDFFLSVQSQIKQERKLTSACLNTLAVIITKFNSKFWKIQKMIFPIV